MDQGPLASADIAGLGVILADGQDGAFAIEIGSIEFDTQAVSDASDPSQT